MLSLTSLLNLRARRALAAAPLLVAALALAPAAASASARPVKYAGKTKEGSKITFTLEHGWLDGLSTMVPTTCVSAQGGTPKVTLWPWSAPYKYRLGRTAKVTTGDPTRHYKISSHRHGKTITGKLSLNFSLLTDDGWGGYRILTCYGTASFKAKPRHR
jgi:hypothetical protein